MRDRYTPPPAECERWLCTDVAAAYDRLKAHPSRGLTINEVRSHLAKARDEREVAAPSREG